MITFLQNHLYFSASLTALFGLIFGSFFNVVISRYPAMLYYRWQQDCREQLNISDKTTPAPANLFSPPSHCPNCKTRLKPWHNIPILSYLFLLGKCAYCHKSISITYPLVEALSALSGFAIVLHFGLNITALAGLIFTWTLLVLSFIDIQEHILPDNLTLPLLWIGLLFNSTNFFTTPASAILGAALAYLLFWTVANTFKIIRKKEGMGYGDFKLFACVCAWLGLGALLNVLFIAVLSSLLISALLLFSRKIKQDQPVPFGPFIALGGWMTLMFGPFMINWLIYIQW